MLWLVAGYRRPAVPNFRPGEAELDADKRTRKRLPIDTFRPCRPPAPTLRWLTCKAAVCYDVEVCLAARTRPEPCPRDQRMKNDLVTLCPFAQPRHKVHRHLHNILLLLFLTPISNVSSNEVPTTLLSGRDSFPNPAAAGAGQVGHSYLSSRVVASCSVFAVGRPATQPVLYLEAA